MIFLKTKDFSPSSEKIMPGQSNKVTFLSICISCIFFVKPGVLETGAAFDFFKLKSIKNSINQSII